MAQVLKVLGQVNPAATTLTTLYTVPGGTEAVVSSIVVANLTGGTALYRIAIRPAGAAIANQHYLAYDVYLVDHVAETITLGISLAATDVISVYSSTASLAFSAFGSEVT